MKTQDLELVDRYQKEIFLLRGAINLLNWDQETNMPKRGADTRADQLAFLESLMHEKITSNQLFSAVTRLKKEKLDEDKKRIIEKLYRDIKKWRKIPKEFVEEVARTTSIAIQFWKEAKEKKDFRIFEPHLNKIVELKRKEAKYIGLPGHPYNSLIDNFEEGMKVEKLAIFFDELKKGLLILLKKIEMSEPYKTQRILLQKNKFEKEKQMQLVRDISLSMGLTNEQSRIDLVEHPFTTTIAGKDVRITTKIKEDYPLSAFTSTIHEAGHALHELGVLKENEFNILGNSPSFGIHESQSKFWENMVGLSEPFWRYYFPKFNKSFNLEGNFEQWYKEVNQVTPGLIRVEADEIHYCLHIILRFEIEKDLISGELNMKDLKKTWNEKIESLFGKSPKDDSEGILQDSHWAGGSFGYFPSYAIGTVYAAQLYKKLLEEIPDIEGDIFEGNFNRINGWLTDKIHQYGAKLLADDLIKKATGQGLNSKIFLDYLNKKYSKIYYF